MGFTTLLACKIIRTSQWHPPMGIRGHLTLLLLQSRPSTAPSGSLCSQGQLSCGPVWHVVFSSPKLCVWLMRRWSKQASDSNPWDLNHCLYRLFLPVSHRKEGPTQQEGSLTASLTSLSTRVLPPSPLPCCQGDTSWGQSQDLRGKEAPREPLLWWELGLWS